MHPEVISFMFVSATIVGLAGSLALIGVTAYRAVTRQPKNPAALDSQSEERFERLQQSVDAIAIEVERIAEAQRFSAKLLVEKNDKPAFRQ